MCLLAAQPGTCLPLPPPIGKSAGKPNFPMFNSEEPGPRAEKGKDGTDGSVSSCRASNGYGANPGSLWRPAGYPVPTREATQTGGLLWSQREPGRAIVRAVYAGNGDCRRGTLRRYGRTCRNHSRRGPEQPGGCVLRSGRRGPRRAGRGGLAGTPARDHPERSGGALPFLAGRLGRGERARPGGGVQYRTVGRA